METLNTKFNELGDFSVPDVGFGDMKLNVFPLTHYSDLPDQFTMFTDAVAAMLGRVPFFKKNQQHYITIDSKFFTVDETQRREGIHIDGNFCADPEFCNNGERKAWGGTTTWGGTKITEDLKITTPWVSPYGIKPPIGKYVSSELGGILCASSHLGCKAYTGKFKGNLQDEGACGDMDLSLAETKLLRPNKLYFMSSDTPHDSITIPKGTRRTFIRLTLNHEYPNKLVKLAA